MSEPQERPHKDGASCWCKPTLYYETLAGSPIWTHYDLGDKRREPPPQMMFDVIAELAWTDHDVSAS